MTQAQIEYTVRWNNESYQSGESDWKEKSFLNFDEAKTFAA